jgi:hypothetical protein
LDVSAQNMHASLCNFDVEHFSIEVKMLHLDAEPQFNNV